MRPILFHIGNFPVRSYGTMLILGFMLCLWRTTRVCARRMQTEPEGSPRRIHPDTIFDFGIGVLLWGLVGARVLFVLLDWGTFSRNPLSAFRIWEGGLSLHGGLIFGILYLIYFVRKRKVPFLVLGDLSAVAFGIAYSFGRIGCLLNGCCYGNACNLPWAVRFPNENGPGLTPPSHPIQLYAAIINMGFFLFLSWWEKRPHRDGELFYAYVALYGVYRFAMEYLRAGATSTYLIPSLHLTDTHLVSLAMMIAGGIGLALLRRNRTVYQDAAFLHSVPAASTPAV